MPATLAGRCANGYERGQGQVVHGVMCGEREVKSGINFYARSLCDKTHGARSAGWANRPDLAVTCPKCLKAIDKLKPAAQQESDPAAPGH
jgi:hypothetical protein